MFKRAKDVREIRMGKFSFKSFDGGPYTHTIGGSTTVVHHHMSGWTVRTYEEVPGSDTEYSCIGETTIKDFKAMCVFCVMICSKITEAQEKKNGDKSEAGGEEASC